MKLCLYQENAEDMQQLCLLVLEESGFQLEQNDTRRGWIHAFRKGDLPHQFYVLDLRINEARFATIVSVFSSVLSGISGSFYDHPEIETTFADSFLYHLRGQKKTQNDFFQSLFLPETSGSLLAGLS